MKVYTTYCDRCGVALNGMVDFEDATIEIAHHWFKADLCEKCLEELYSMAAEFCTKVEGKG